MTDLLVRGGVGAQFVAIGATQIGVVERDGCTARYVHFVRRHPVLFGQCEESARLLGRVDGPLVGIVARFFTLIRWIARYVPKARRVIEEIVNHTVDVSDLRARKVLTNFPTTSA